MTRTSRWPRLSSTSGSRPAEYAEPIEPLIFLDTLWSKGSPTLDVAPFDPSRSVNRALRPDLFDRLADLQGAGAARTPQEGRWRNQRAGDIKPTPPGLRRFTRPVKARPTPRTHSPARSRAHPPRRPYSRPTADTARRRKGTRTCLGRNPGVESAHASRTATEDRHSSLAKSPGTEAGAPAVRLVNGRNRSPSERIGEAIVKLLTFMSKSLLRSRNTWAHENRLGLWRL
jgi:hypothetical protein